MDGTPEWMPLHGSMCHSATSPLFFFFSLLLRFLSWSHRIVLVGQTTVQLKKPNGQIRKEHLRKYTYKIKIWVIQKDWSETPMSPLMCHWACCLDSNTMIKNDSNHSGTAVTFTRALFKSTILQEFQHTQRIFQTPFNLIQCSVYHQRLCQGVNFI